MTENNDRKVTKKANGFSDLELKLMKERAQELKKEARINKSREAGEKDVFTAIESMSEPDRTLAKRIHAIVKNNAPGLWPKLWYGMPAYARDGKVICFFQSASKFKVRYATFGFQPEANLDEGAMWPVSFAVKNLTDIEETKIADLVKKAIS